MLSEDSLRKNFILKIRSPIGCIAEILLPVMCVRARRWLPRRAVLPNAPARCCAAGHAARRARCRPHTPHLCRAASW